MQFSDTTNLNGLIQVCERITQLGDAGISGNTVLLKAFTSRINQALDRFVSLVLMADGTWQWDDVNYTDFPIGTNDLVSGQYDYTFASDVLAVDKVLIADPSGNWIELQPVDMHEKRLASRNIWQRPGSSGIPTSYDKFAHSLLLDPVPNYDYANGLKVAFARNASKFVYTDTSKEPGIPSIFHPYLARYASLSYLAEVSHSAFPFITQMVINDEQAISEWFSKRGRDEKIKIKTVWRSAR